MCVINIFEFESFLLGDNNILSDVSICDFTFLQVSVIVVASIS